MTQRQVAALSANAQRTNEPMQTCFPGSKLTSGTSAVSTLLLCLFATAAAAAPDAGSVQQEIMRSRATGPAAEASFKTDAPQVIEKPLTGKTFVVREFAFEGNTLLSSGQLALALSSCLNKEVDFERLKACAALVTDSYQSAGRIAKAVLPEQDVLDGKITIRVIESRFGNYIFTGQSAARVSNGQLQKIFYSNQKPGELLDMTQLDRALLLADDLPGVGVSGNLEKGSQEGFTDLVLQLADEPLVSGNVSMDNNGSVSTGANRLNLSLNGNSPLKMGDYLSVMAMASAGTRFVRVEETMPLGSSGLRVGFNTSYLNYKLVGSQYASLDANGVAQTFGLSASYPLIRSREKNLNLNLGMDEKKYLNMAAGNSVSDYGIRTTAFGLDGNVFDELMGGGANYGSLSSVWGYKDLIGSANQASDAQTANTQGSFNKIRYAFSRQQKFNADWSAFFNYSGQTTSRNLDSSESFYLGGSTGVRAYPTNEARGSEGQLVNMEIRTKLPLGFSWVGFYDWGRVLGYPKNNFTGASELNTIKLQGYGMALTWQTNSGNTLKGIWSRRVGSNPGATKAGFDQDGSFLINRFWLSASLAF
jgi:hemolysin activation/secretion protein